MPRLPTALLPVLIAALLSACGGRDAFTSEAGLSEHERELKRAFALCAGCHGVAPEHGNRVGPNLYRVIGRQVGSLPGYSYSTALAESDLVWDEQNLDTFMRNPPAMFHGTRMVVATSDPARRAAIIQYLKQHQ